jgi:hypothetical protein
MDLKSLGVGRLLQASRGRMLTREELAKLVIEVMDAQRRYFATSTRSQATLEASKALEKRLRHECERILEPPGLFSGDDE